MPNYNAIWQFKAYGYGWTERWFLGGLADPTRAMVAFTSCQDARRDLLGQGAQLVRATVRDDNSANTALALSFNTTPPPSIVGSPVDTPWNSVLAFLTGGNATYRRRLWLRGVPDAAITFDNGGAPLLDPAFLNKIKAFATVANANRLGWKVLNTAAPINQPKQIGGLGTDAAGRVNILCPAHGFTVGTRVGVSKVTGLNLRQQRPGRKSINGYWTVAFVTDANNFSIPLPVYTLTGTPVWRGKGQAKGLLPTSVTVDRPEVAGIEWRFARKTVGRQLNIVRGKAPVGFRTFD